MKIIQPARQANNAQQQAVTLLARREHSQYELEQKLSRAGYDNEDIEQAITALSRAGLQDDQRFAEHFMIYRSQRGYGPNKIQMELQHRGVEKSLISQVLRESDTDWYQLAQQVRIKKFGAPPPTDRQQQAKQHRFLQYRGFDYDHINHSFLS
ncbi:MAG TPA: recombination regulator RecX [Gammaproteobacteria bacterium]|nr:recombination regulator RecX [Gammaproteobacteria bacterium]HAU06904.1 recombination regulator RecX [Gammaproteobacteria bacterium]